MLKKNIFIIIKIFHIKNKNEEDIMAENSTEFIRIEHEILDFWEKNNTFNKLKKQNEGNTPFRFIDGPMTANNAMGIHHAWGRTVKDIFIRYHAMKGHDCRYQNGFDSQGLWVEVEVEKQLGFKTKKDIEALYSFPMLSFFKLKFFT